MTHDKVFQLNLTGHEVARLVTLVSFAEAVIDGSITNTEIISAGELVKALDMFRLPLAQKMHLLAEALPDNLNDL
jgi:hypothetical protein